MKPRLHGFAAGSIGIAILRNLFIGPGAAVCAVFGWLALIRCPLKRGSPG